MHGTKSRPRRHQTSATNRTYYCTSSLLSRGELIEGEARADGQGHPEGKKADDNKTTTDNDLQFILPLPVDDGPVVPLPLVVHVETDPLQCLVLRLGHGSLGIAGHELLASHALDGAPLREAIVVAPGNVGAGNNT